MSAEFPHLLSPLSVRSVRLRNRSLMGAMHTGLEETGDWARVRDFYAARAQGGAGLIVTAGIAPNAEGAVFPGAARLADDSDIANHQGVTRAVHDEGGAIVLQILHAGRYGFGPDCVAPSAIRAPIAPFAPRALDAGGVEAQIDAIAATAARAVEAGYDGVEIMGSEGYFLNQFLARRTNQRTDAWGGDYANRMRIVVDSVARVRAALGEGRILVYRLSLLDLVPDGSDWAEIVALAQRVEAAGADLLNSGIGWHEARVPTIAASVPRAAFVDLTAALRREVGIPVVASNRITTPALAEAILAAGQADMVSMARPWLADAAFIAKAMRGKADRIAPCIACNQACLDHTFEGKLASCLVNPRAAHEAELAPRRSPRPRRIAVVGAGPAGCMAAITAAECGHRVTLYERGTAIGGQLDLARRVPGKAEFDGLIGWFDTMLAACGVAVRLGQAPGPGALSAFDHVIVATGVSPRSPGIPTDPDAPVLGYAEALRGAPVGPRVAIIGAGGIGFDVATALVEAGADPGLDVTSWRKLWGVVPPWEARGGLTAAQPGSPARAVTLMQRKAERPGRSLGKTTGWIHRAHLASKGVRFVTGLRYDRLSAEGVWYSKAPDAQPELLEVDSIVLCAGQVSERGLVAGLKTAGIAHDVIGGAAEAAELDAKRAIDQAVRLALTL